MTSSNDVTDGVEYVDLVTMNIYLSSVQVLYA